MTTKQLNVSDFKTYLDQVEELPADALLGRMVLFTITDHGVPVQDVYEAINDLDLHAAYPPAPNKYLDSFKKATSDVKDTYAMPKGRTAHLLCREVNFTHEYQRRQITREIKDSGKKKLGYAPAIDATFYKPTDVNKQETARLNIVVNQGALEPDEVALITEIANGIAARYARYFRTFDGLKIRAFVRNYLKKLNAVEIKGGVYFVPVSRDEELGRLVEFVSRMGGGCRMNTIPMVNLEKEREFITEIFEREASDSLREITKEVEHLLATRKGISAAAYARLKERYDEVLSNATEHMDNLQVTQDVTAAAAEVAFESIQKLMEAMLND